MYRWKRPVFCQMVRMQLTADSGHSTTWPAADIRMPPSMALTPSTGRGLTVIAWTSMSEALGTICFAVYSYSLVRSICPTWSVALHRYSSGTIIANVFQNIYKLLFLIDGFTPLMLASFCGGGLEPEVTEDDDSEECSANIISDLTFTGSMLAAQTDRTGETALHLACTLCPSCMQLNDSWMLGLMQTPRIPQAAHLCMQL